MESIEERLLGIEDSLRTLVVETKKRAPQTTGIESPAAASSIAQKMTVQPLPQDSPRPDIGENFDGDTSLLAHSLHAKEIFEKLSSAISSKQSPKLKTALLSLQKTLKSENEPGTFHDLRFATNQERAKSGSSELEMPPMQTVLELLRYSNGMFCRSHDLSRR